MKKFESVQTSIQTCFQYPEVGINTQVMIFVNYLDSTTSKLNNPDKENLPYFV